MGLFAVVLLMMVAAAVGRPEPRGGPLLSMTLCSQCDDFDGCSHDPDRTVYHPPCGCCYSPPALWPGDHAWGDSDVLDDCSSDGVTRRLYASTNGTCAGTATDRFELPLDVCLGPFGKPRPWGVFNVTL